MSLRAWAGRWYRFARTDRMGRPHKTPAPPPFASPSGGGAGPHPVPGQQEPPSAHGRPPRPVPAPAYPPAPAHITGPVSFMVYGWECGCELDFDGAGRVIWATSCAPGDAHGRFDDWLKGLTDASD